MPAPSAAFRAYAERQGIVAHTLFELSVTHPTPAVWVLAAAPVDIETGMFDPTVFDPGTFATGLGEVVYAVIREHSGVAASAALGGVVGAAGVTLTIDNALGTDGPGRKWMDRFVRTVPGSGEPYDLRTLTCRALIRIEGFSGESLQVAGGLHLQPEGVAWRAGPGEPETVTLTFGPDQRRYRPLPRKTVTTRRYPHAPDGSIDAPVIPWFGAVQIPLTPLDPDGGLHLIGASPAATPLGGVTKLGVLRPEPGVENAEPSFLPVQTTTAGQSVLSISGNGTALDLKQVAQRFEIEGDGVFASHVVLTIRRKVAGTAAVGSITGDIVLEQDALPGEELVDRGAAFEINASLITSGTFAQFVIPFLSNSKAVAPFLPGRRGLWLRTRFAKDSGGDLQIEVDATGAYPKGLLAKRDTANTDEAWILIGKQQRRGLVRDDFTGGGHLRQDVATGAIVTRPPVTVPGF